MNGAVKVSKQSRMTSLGLLVRFRIFARNAINWGRGMVEEAPKRSARLSSLYYLALSREFDLEHQAVLAGKRAVSGVADSNKKAFILRRLVHRLEKGLIMRPRRNIFAEDYIETAVNYFVELNGKGFLAQQELDWFSGVLHEYFDVVADTPLIAASRQKFHGIISSRCGAGSIPYPARFKPESNVSYKDLDALTIRRSSVRWYQDRPVSLDLVRAAVDTACNAPSACNRQPYSFHVTSSKEAAVALARCAGGAAGFADNVQCVVAVTGNLAAYVHERDRHIIYIDAALAAMQFLLAVETLGLASCVINWPDVSLQEQKIRSLLDIAVHERVIMLISVGYADPDGGVPFSQKNRSNKVMKLVSIKGE